MKARILILDDDATRHALFAKRFSMHECVHVETFDDFRREILHSERFSHVFLDHDLNDYGHRSVVEGASMYGGRESTELTGTDAAKVMVSQLLPEKRPERVIIHSWNIVGAERMRNILEDAGFNVVVQPFEP